MKSTFWLTLKQPLPQLADVGTALVHGELTRSHAVVGGGVAGVLEVRAVVARARPARLGNYLCIHY